MSLNETLGDIFYEIFNYEGKLTDDLNPLSVSGWDSIAHIALVEAIEYHFDIKLTTGELLDMTSVREIKNVLKNHRIQD